MQTRELGRSGLVVSAMGLGCMGMSEFYGAHDDDESLATIGRAAELGVTFLDTADMYGRGANESLVGRAVAGRRDRFVVATKFGVVRSDDPTSRSIDGSPTTCARRAKRAYGVSASRLSTSTTNTESIRVRRSRRPSRRWPRS